MNTKLSLYLSAFLFTCCSFKICDSFIVLEPEHSEEIQINSFSDHKLDSNALNTPSVKKNSKFSETRTLNINQTFSTLSLKQNQNQMSAKKVIQKFKSCFSCNKEKIQLILKEEQYIQRLEFIKQQILSKLGMSEAPKMINRNLDNYNYIQLLEASSLAQTPETITKTEPQESDKVFIFPTIKKFNISQFNISVAKDSLGVDSITKITLFAKHRTSLPNQNLDNSIDKELAVISTAVPVNGVLTRFQDISNVRVLGIVEPQMGNDKLSGIDRQLFSNWLQYDLTVILKPEVIKANKLVSFDGEDESVVDMKDSFITIEQNINNTRQRK